MAILPGSGAKIQWNGSDVEHWTSIEPEISYENQEATDGGDAASRTKPTVQNCRLTVTCRRDTSSTVQNAIIADFLAKTPRAWKYYEDASKYYTGTSYIASLTPGSADPKNLIPMTFTIENTSDGTAVTYN